MSNQEYQGFPSTLIPNSFLSQMANGTCDATSPQAFVTANPRVAGQLAITIGGTKHTGDVVTVVISNGALPTGAVTVAYTTASGDTTASIAEGINNLITSNTTLQQYDIFSTVYQNVITFNQLGPVSQFTSIAVAVTGSAHSVTAAFSNPTLSTITIGGSETDADELILQFTNANFSGGLEQVTYTTSGSETLSHITAGLATAVNADAVLIAAGITATYVSGTSFTVSQIGPNYAPITNQGSGGNTETVTIVDSTAAVTGGSGAAVPLKNFSAALGVTTTAFRYFIPFLVPYTVLKTLVKQGYLIK